MFLPSLIVLAAAAASAPPPMINQMTIAGAWFRALPAHLPAGGYFSLHNTGQATATLTGADSPDCGMLMMHKSEQAGGTDSMADVSSVDIPPGQTVKFAPGGYHLMCTDPGPAIRPGNSVPVRLRFSDGSAATVRFVVKTATGQ